MKRLMRWLGLFLLRKSDSSYGRWFAGPSVNTTHIVWQKSDRLEGPCTSRNAAGRPCQRHIGYHVYTHEPVKEFWPIEETA